MAVTFLLYRYITGFLQVNWMWCDRGIDHQPGESISSDSFRKFCSKLKFYLFALVSRHAKLVMIFERFTCVHVALCRYETKSKIEVKSSGEVGFSEFIASLLICYNVLCNRVSTYFLLIPWYYIEFEQYLNAITFLTSSISTF